MGFRRAVHSDLPRVLYLLREVHRWSKTEVARRCGISVSLYSRYESGQVEPTLSNILKMCDAFGVDFETLVGRKPLRIVPSEKGSSFPA